MSDGTTGAAQPALTQMLARASVTPRLLAEPGPSVPELELAVSAALTAPDHGMLRPWRFVTVEGEARARLGALLVESLLRRMPDAPTEALAKEEHKPQRAPLVIVAGAAIRHGHKIPVWEQEAAAAAGIMNLMHALEAQGYGTFWSSSPALGDPALKQALGFPETDRLLGFIHVGTLAGPKPEPHRPAPGDYWRSWSAG
jgi:nitroreductase